jgi:hypothetical protein
VPIAPPAEAIEAVFAHETFVLRKVDIYESDGVTPWRLDVGVLDGQVSVDAGRDERRTFDLTLWAGDGDLPIGPDDGLWYDKQIKIYRGVQYGVGADALDWYAPLGSFMIDRITQPLFPTEIKITGRDLTKKLITSKFGRATQFKAGTPMETVVRTIATNAGIVNFNFPNTGVVLGKDFLFEADATRKKAIFDIVSAYGYDCYFDGLGFLVLQEQADPASDAPIITLQTGAGGAVVNFEKSVNDTRLYNHIVVTGENSSGQTPVVAEARNTEPSSPTRIERIGERTYRYTSSFITTTSQAQDVANKFLKLHSLEEFSVRIDAFVLPWLEAGQTIEFLDPNPTQNQPTKFFLHSFNIPMNLSPMSIEARRVELVT